MTKPIDNSCVCVSTVFLLSSTKSRSVLVMNLLSLLSHRQSNGYHVPDQRTQSLNMDEEEETISVDDEESEDEGPHSWPGMNISSSRPLLSSVPLLKPIGGRPSSLFPVPPRTALPPMLLNPATSLPSRRLPVPTLFTIVPSGLVQTTPTRVGTFIPQTATVANATMSPLSKANSPLVPEMTLPGPTFGYTQQKPTVPIFSPLKPSQQPIGKCATTLAAIPPEEMTPAYYQLKEFAESFKTKRIQLGYTQGAVGQSLADRGYSNFAQSTISRFEQMQLSPSNAAAIKIVLERWLIETDNPQAVTSTTLDPLGPPRKRKKRAVFSSQTRDTLEEYFQKEARPNRQIIEAISNDLGLLPEEVRVWFCNKRQKFKVSDDNSSDDRYSDPTSPSSTRSCSPPRTRFTIEELSKSSTATNHTFSPVSFASSFTCSPPNLQSIVLPPGNTYTIASPSFFLNNLVTKA